jgi:hypothetical protein
VADVLPDRFQTHRDLLDQVLFSLRRGVFFASLRSGVTEVLRYATSRHARPLTRFARRDVEALATETGLRVEFLPRNLTCRTARLSVLLRAADAGRLR